MRISKLDISEKLIEGYVKVPPSLKEQIITTMAIHLCQNVNLRKDIIFKEELPQRACNPWPKWDLSIEAGSTNVCQKLPLPSALTKPLVARMRTIALQLYDWSKQQVKFKLPPLYATSLLIPSDWIVAEMRLDEEKIAIRLVQDRRIPLHQQYRMACFHCLEDFILPLWELILHESRDDFFDFRENKVVQSWSAENYKKLKESISTPSDVSMWRRLLQLGVLEGSISSVLHSWDKLDTSIRQDVLIHTAVNAMKIFFKTQYTNSKRPSTDTLCFLLSHMSKEQRISFFQTAFQNAMDCILVCFLRWPYMDLLLPIINELWAILPKSKYHVLLSVLARSYSDTDPYTFERKDYIDYEYGYLIIELLKDTPDHFKRYAFGNPNVTNSVRNGKLLYTILGKGDHKIQYREVSKLIWQHITLEERRFFLRSYHGDKLCRDLAKQGNCELLASILRA